MSPAEPSVVFLDLATLLGDRRLPRLHRDARAELREGRRAGVLTNAARELGRPGLLQTLAALGLDGRVDEQLVIDAAVLPVPLPDHRAFAAAAAIAEVAPGACRFVTGSPGLAAAAERAGMQVLVAGATSPERRRARAAADAGFRPGAAPPDDLGELPFGAALIDEDTGPTFVLDGRIVTMSRRGVIDGRIAIRRGRIVAIVERGEALPPTLRNAPLVETGGTIYPGLIDLHNHFVYDVAPLWRVPKAYKDRSQWFGEDSKKAEVSQPVKLLAAWPPTARAIVRYVEAKALMGGTTAGQGMKTQVKGGYGPFRGAMRNVESTDDPRLPDSGTLVGSLRVDAEHIEDFAEALRKRGELGSAYFYHLAEGTDHRADRTFRELESNGLLGPALAAIHALGVDAPGLRTLRAAKASIVWSPFSNLLLYGRTLDLRALLSSKARFAIGADWTPSGSRNLLEELKVARHVVREQGVAIDDERLVQAVTADAAAIVGWGDHLGRLRERSLADLVVVAGVADDPYAHLIDAVERDVRLVVVHGVPRYGDRAPMEALHAAPEHPLEPWTVHGVEKRFALHARASTINDLSLAGATAALRGALDDLPAFVGVVEAGAEQFRAFGIDPAETFQLVLDNEDGGGGEDGADGDGTDAFAAALTDTSLLPPRLELDGLVVGGADYWSRIEDQHNLDPQLGAAIRAAYPQEEP